MDKLTIVINSCKVYATATLPPLIDNIKKNNPGFKILVIIGDHVEKRIISVEDNITIIETDNNSIDYTAMITLLEKPEILTTDWFLYLHDTIQLGPTFFQKLQGINLENFPKKITTISFQFPSANIGLYHKDVISRLKPAILKFKNQDNSILHELKSLFVAAEDAIFRMNMQEHTMFPTKPDTKWNDPLIDLFNTGRKRLTEYYADLDFWKVKATFALAYTYTLEP